MEQIERSTARKLAKELAWVASPLSSSGRAHTFGDSEGGAPLVAQDVQADATVRVDVRVVDTGGEVNLRRLEGVVGREVDG